MFTLAEENEHESASFETADAVASYLGQVAASEYANKVMDWVDNSTTPELRINNGPNSVDVWRRIMFTLAEEKEN